MRRICVVVLLALIAAGGCKDSKPQGELTAGGSTFVAPLMESWGSAYEAERRIKLHYDVIGSGKGITQTIDKTLDFGCTDAPLTDQELKKAQASGGEIIHIPLVLGAVVPTYNLDGYTGDTTPLRFTGPLLADIFLGKITQWNDPRLQEVQESGMKLPDQKIVVVHRSDGSGTTYVFADYLSKVSPEWKEKVGAATSLSWPAGVGQNGNEGVAQYIKQTPGAIGYVGLEHAIEDELPFGAVQNKTGKFLQANAHTIGSAAEAALVVMPSDLRFSLTDVAGSDSYPICGTTWAIVYPKPPRHGKEIVDFLRWATHEGQKLAPAKHYVALPGTLVNRVEQKLAAVTVK
jgi:phosphate ABC transporter phosphate-binding protein